MSAKIRNNKMKRFRIFKFISYVCLVVSFHRNVQCLTIDNMLVSAGEECFERIALGAMLPLDKAFRTDDINSERKCKELCISIGEKCQTIAFGLSVRGNGTCQISSEKIEVVGSRPIGTIFDPSFDLFSRKTNCLNLSAMGGDFPSQLPPSDNGRPTTAFGAPSTFPGTSDSTGFPPSTVESQATPDRYSPRPSGTPTDFTGIRYPSTAPGYTTGTDEGSMGSTYGGAPGNTYSGGPGSTYSVNENTDDRNYPTRTKPTPSYPTTMYGYDQNTYSNRDRDRVSYSEGNPLYPTPTLYDSNYPSTNGRPVTYAQNIPTVHDRYNQNESGQRGTTQRPMTYGSGYGNGYSYGTPDPNRKARPGGDRTDYYQPTSGSFPSDYDRNNSKYPKPRPDYPPDTRRPDYGSTDNMGNGYDRPDLSYGRPSNIPTRNGYEDRPESPDRRPSYSGPNDIPTRNGHDQRPESPDRRPGYSGQTDIPNRNGYDQRPDSPDRRPGYSGQTDIPSRNGYDQRPQSPDTRPGYSGQTDTPTRDGYDQRPESPDRRPGYGGQTDIPSRNGYDQRPESPDRRPGYSGQTDIPTRDGYGQRPESPDRRPGHSGQTDIPTRNGYDQRPDSPDRRPTNGYNIRPESPDRRPSNGLPTNQPSDGYRPSESSRPPDYNYNKNITQPQDQYGQGINRTKPYDRPYDNNRPDYEPRPEAKPGGYGGGYDSGSRVDSGYSGDHHPGMEHMACFRRVLAGKRIAPHWVRRTLACERIEDCMQECGHEKRFQCEGFNYRLDPSGHGQGDCELIEIPLAQMDLYSSTQHRDANLLRHPDYDYYERDRNAPSSCRQLCKDCGGPKPISSPPIYFRPSPHEKPYHQEEHYPILPPSSSGYDSHEPERYRPPPSTAVDRYRPPYESRPEEYHHYDFSSHSQHDSSGSGGYYRPPSPPHSSYGGDRIDRYDDVRPDDSYRPNRWEPIPSGHGGSSYGGDFHVRPLEHVRPDGDRPDSFRPPYRPGPDYSPYRSRPPIHMPQDDHYVPAPPSSHGYLDRDQPSYKKPSKFIPYLIDSDRDNDSGSYGYGGSTSSYNKNADYWGIQNSNRRKDGPDFNYFDLGSRHPPHPSDNSIYSYPGSKYPEKPKPDYQHDYGNQWTRRPGPDECSVKSSEGFRLHKGAIRHAYTVPTITECEKLCHSEDKFICHTYSYRYSNVGRENCLLCDRPVNHLDYYVDLEPDRDYDVYSMSDEEKSCRQRPQPNIPTIGGGGGGGPGGHSTAISDPRNNAQCFFRAIDATRFFKSIVRDSLTVRSIGECELECIKSSKFSCRAFAFRYGQRTRDSIIDNCQLSDWPVRDMDKERHLILDPSFDVFERASYGHGCEIQPIVDDKHKKLCYLGYGSPAKLLTPAIKKVISVPTELECKKECIRFRENSSFKCYSFSFGSQVSTYNCEMSDLDQSELKLNIHYSHTNNDRDYWLFAWNPFDWTCRDKVATVGGNRVNNDRRMDIFREPGDVTWRHYTVSGKPCRVGDGCDKNLVTGFYSCETDGGEIGSWDYCCKADYPCGYSQGFDYPWCFVGDEPDQWRKCSDRYYPGNRTHTHAGITLPPSKDKDKKQHSQQQEHHPTEHVQQRPPRPGGLQSLTDFTAARLWPVTYLYSEGPPNSTELSNFVDCNKETC